MGHWIDINYSLKLIEKESTIKDECVVERTQEQIREKELGELYTERERERGFQGIFYSSLVCLLLLGLTSYK